MSQYGNYRGALDGIENKKVYIPYKKFFKLLKKAIKTAKNKEELNKYYDKAVEHQKYFAPGEGRLIEEMYFNKMKGF